MKKYTAIGLGLLALSVICGWCMIGVFSDTAFMVLSGLTFVSCVSSIIVSIIAGKKEGWWPGPVLNILAGTVTLGFFALTELLIYALSQV